MSIVLAHRGAPTGTAHLAHSAGFRDTPRPWTVGQEVAVSIHRQLGGPYYLATVAGRAGQVVASSVSLKAGTPLRAVVVAVGARLELKLLNPGSGATLVVGDPDANADESLEADSEAQSAAAAADAALVSQIDTLNARYQVPLTSRDHGRLTAAMKTVPEPRNMALAGLYLAKLGLPLTPNSLDALYEVQDDSTAKRSIGPAALNLGGLVENLAPRGQSAALEALVERMDLTLNRSTGAGAALTAGDDSQSRSDSEANGELARELLNVPAGATVARHYGTIPVLVSGQLLELQFVAFQHRQTGQEQNPVRRLFMTLDTAALGRLQITAQAQGNRLSVTFTSDSSQATEALATHAPEVRELVGRLGWQVDSVVYSTGRSTGAAEIAMTHTLLDNTMDQLL